MIDQVTSGDRDAAMQDILNTLDGGDTKNMNVISIFTTNHIEKINPTLLRGKRIGSMIEIGHLDAETAMKYIHVCFDSESGYNIDSEGMEEVCKEIEMNEIVPAFMAEICEKVKTNMIFDDTNTVTALAIKSSLNQYLGHVKLSKLQDTSETKEQVLYKAFSGLVCETIQTKVEEVINKNIKIDEIYNYCN